MVCSIFDLEHHLVWVHVVVVVIAFIISQIIFKCPSIFIFWMNTILGHWYKLGLLLLSFRVLHLFAEVL